MAQIVEAIRANLGLVLFVTGGPALTVVNKEILDTGFREPVIVSGFGMFATMLFTRVLAASGRLHIPKREPYFWFRSCLPVGASAMATMAFGNAAYLYLNVSFIQMLKAGTPVVLMLMLYISGVSLMVKVTPRLALSVVGMFVGVVIASLGEVRLTVLGLLAMFFSEVSAGVRCILEEWLLTKMEPRMGVLEALYYLAPACVLSQAVVAIILHLQRMDTGAEGKDPEGIFKPASFSPEELRWFITLVACSGTLGIAVNTGSLLVTQSYSSLFMKSVVIVRNIGLVMWGVGWYNEAVTAVELVGYSVTLACFAWYNYEHHLAKTASAKTTDGKSKKKE